MGCCTSVTASRMTDAYGASTPAGVPPRRPSDRRAAIRKGCLPSGPSLSISPDDPAGAEPRRDHRFLRLLHEGDLLRCFRNSVSVTYVSTLPSTSSSAPCISSFVQSLSTFETNVREWHFVQHSLFSPAVEARSAEDPGKEGAGKERRPRQGVALPRQSISATPWRGRGVRGGLCFPRVVGATPLRPVAMERAPLPGCHADTPPLPVDSACETAFPCPLIRPLRVRGNSFTGISDL